MNVIAEHRRSRIPARSSDVWSGIVVPLPLAIPPSQIVNCNLITVQYKLLVTRLKLNYMDRELFLL